MYCMLPIKLHSKGKCKRINVSLFYSILMFLFLINSNVTAKEFSSNVIKVKSGIYNISTKENALIYYDKTNAITHFDARKLLENSMFSKYNEANVPDYYKRGKFTNWIYLCIENMDTISIPLSIINISNNDSVFVSDNGKLFVSNMVQDIPTKDKDGILNVAFNRMYHFNINAGQSLELLIKHYDYSYGVGNNIPSISDTRVLESKYYVENSGQIFFYTSGIFIILSIVLIFGFQWVFSREKLYLWYCLYSLSYLFVIWRNLEDIQPIFYFTFYYLSWNDTKVFHSIAVFYTYIVFCCYFLDFDPPILKKIVKSFSYFCITAIFIELIFLSLGYNDHTRWLFYKFVRFVLTLLGVASIFIAMRSRHILAKYIILGSSCMALAEILSMILPTRFSSNISLLGVYADFILFAVALGIRSKYIENEKMKLTLENLRLQAEKESEASQLKSRIANDIHDEIGLGLTSANYLLYNIMKSNTNNELDNEVKRVIGLNSEMVTQLHNIIWSMDESKDNIHEFGSDLKAIFIEFQYNHNVKGQFSQTNDYKDIKVNGFLRRNILMCMKEGLNNAVKHGKATIIDVHLTWTKSNIVLHSKDNGRGFNEHSTTNPTHGNGIKNMHKRVQDCGGKVTFYNANGANIYIEIPIEI